MQPAPSLGAKAKGSRYPQSPHKYPVRGEDVALGRLFVTMRKTLRYLPTTLPPTRRFVHRSFRSFARFAHARTHAAVPSATTNLPKALRGWCMEWGIRYLGGSEPPRLIRPRRGGRRYVDACHDQVSPTAEPLSIQFDGYRYVVWYFTPDSNLFDPGPAPGP